MSRPTISEILAAHPPQPALTLLTARQGVLMSAALILLSVVLLHRIANGPALAVWATALLVISTALPCLPSIAAAVGMTGVAVLAAQAWPLPHAVNTFEMVGVGLIGAFAFVAGHALARLHRLRVKIIARNAQLGLKTTVLEYLVEQYRDGIALLDGEGKILAHNPRYREWFFPQAHNPLVGSSWLDTVNNTRRIALDALLERALRLGTAHDRIQCGQRYYELDLRALSPRQTDNALVVCTLRAQTPPDTTASLMTGLSSLASVAQTRGEGFMVCDRNGRIITVNAQAQTAARRNGVVTPQGHWIWELFDWFPKGWADATAQPEAWEQPVCRELFDTSGQRWHEVTVFSWQDGFAVLYRDITTARNNAERASEMAARWDLARTYYSLGEWRFDLENSEFLFCTTARLWLGLPPDCERISKQQLLERVNENDRLILVQGIIGLASTPLALLDLTVRVRPTQTPCEELRLHWLGRQAEDQRPARLFGTLQRMA